MQPTTVYAKSGDVHVAYQVFGEGPVNLVLGPGFISNIDHYWEDARCARWLTRLAEFSRLVIFDKRGTGLSDQVSSLPTMDERMDDMRAVMDAVGMDRAAVMGVSEGGSLATVFAAHHQDRADALVIYGGFAQFRHWFPTEESLQALFGYIDTQWGSGASLPMFAPALAAADPSYQNWFGRFERLGATPGAAIALMKMNSEIDTLDILSAIHVPTLILHKTQDTMVSVEGGRMLANNIPHARLFEMEGTDHMPWADGYEPYVQEIEEFLTGARTEPITDRLLATVVFTDIVDSTARASKLGDGGWSDLIDHHDKTVQNLLERNRGRLVKSLGDGILATFDGPGRAIRFSQELRDALSAMGIEVRQGLHTGEIEVSDDDVSGIAVNISARVMELAGPTQIFLSRTVKDLVAGSGLQFKEVGRHQLKGIPDEWEIFSAV